MLTKPIPILMSASKLHPRQAIAMALCIFGFCLPLSAQHEAWYIGAQITPQQSFIFNRNDRLASKVPSGADISSGGIGHRVYNMKPENNELIAPNSISTGAIVGYRFSEWFSLESGLTYSFQQQKFDQNLDDQDSYVWSRNVLHLVKLSLSSCLSVPISEFSWIDVKLGLQPTYTLSGSEVRKAHFPGIISETGYKNGEYFAKSEGTVYHRYKTKESIYKTWNFEALASVGIRFQISHISELFFLFRVDHSLLDIENKSVIIHYSSGKEALYYDGQTPFKYAVFPTDCPGCEPVRPPSHNFTAGLSIGYIYYFD